MFVISIAIAAAYLLLLLISIFFDPKRKAIVSKQKYSIYKMLLFSTTKMLIVIALVVTVALIADAELIQVFGLTGFSLNWQSLGQGLVLAAGFAIIYIMWQILAKRFSPKEKGVEKVEGSIINILPKSWIPLIGTFAIISFEAGLFEEIFFRGIIQSNVLNYITPVWAVIIAALCFGFGHFYQGVSGVVVTLVLGIWLGAGFAITGNLFVAILGHFLGDFTCMMLSGKQIMRRNKG